MARTMARKRTSRKRAPSKKAAAKGGRKTAARRRGGKREGATKRSPGHYGERARGFLGEEIRHHVKEKGMPQDQAVAAAMSEARRKGMTVPRRRGKAKGD